MPSAGTFTTGEEGESEGDTSSDEAGDADASSSDADGDSGDGDTSDSGETNADTDAGSDTSGDGDGDDSTSTSTGDGDGDDSTSTSTGDGDGDDSTSSSSSGDGDSTGTTTGDGDGDGDDDSACDGATTMASGSPAMIDDFEDGNLTVLPNDGRTGSWSSWSDGSGSLSPDMIVEDVIDGPAGSTRALHFGGTGFTGWGAGTGPTFFAAGCYDFSAYTGLTFWAKGSGTLRMAVATADTHEFYDCDAMSEECSNHYHAPDISLGSSWTQHTFTWAQLAQPGWGPAKPFDQSKGVSLSFSHIAEGGGPDFDIWVDELAFTTQ